MLVFPVLSSTLKPPKNSIMLFRINKRIYGVRNLLIDAFKAISILAACIVIAAFVVILFSMFALAFYSLMGWPGVILLILAACGFVFIGTNA